MKKLPAQLRQQLSVSQIDPDAQWFGLHSDRQAHIREPVKMLHIDKQRHTFYADECELEFRTLGDHKKDRRRILLWKVPVTNKFYNPSGPQIMKIPFLLFADETVEDDDKILLPIIDELMLEKARQYGMIPRGSGLA